MSWAQRGRREDHDWEHWKESLHAASWATEASVGPRFQSGLQRLLVTAT